MKKLRRTQIISYLLMASLLFSFWICVEECQAETKSGDEINLSLSENTGVENAEKDFCSIQTAPLAFISNQELFVPVNSPTLPNHFRKTIFRKSYQSSPTPQKTGAFVKMPFKLLHQLRI